MWMLGRVRPSFRFRGRPGRHHWCPSVIDLSDKWYLSCYADVGAGDSKLTWQAWPGVGYRFEKVDVVAGYRHLAWETDDGDTLDDLNFSGPMLGVKFRF